MSAARSADRDANTREVFAELAFGRFGQGDYFREVLDALPAEQRLRLPMREGCRSLNLSNTVAVAVYEAWRQNGFN